MELSVDEKNSLRKGLDMQITEKDYIILGIKHMSEEDFQLEKRLHEKGILKGDFNLEVAKEGKINKVRAEIVELGKLRERLNVSSSQVLIVPGNIQLVLGVK